jgi:radical SAM superfamily enzyme YgiQ (UPF0313 family)
VKFAFVLPKSVERRSELQYLPLGVGYLASVLIEEGHEVEVVDGRIKSYSDEEILDGLGRINPDVVCATSRTYDISENVTLLKRVKDSYPEVRTVLGGPHISALPEETMRQHGWIDYGIRGEGEATIKELAGRLESGRGVGDVKGIVYRSNGGVVKTADRGFIQNLDSIPFPARHLFDLRRYDGKAVEVKEKPMASIITSRGCPHQCIFCCKSTFGSVYRGRSPENVL